MFNVSQYMFFVLSGYAVDLHERVSIHPISIMKAVAACVYYTYTVHISNLRLQ